MRNLFPEKVIEKTREIAQEKNEPNVPEEDEEEAHDKR
jgi:hypothetical protein